MGEKELKSTLSRSSASFRSLNSEFHMVIFFDRCVFDYIPDTRELRPYNSGYWTKLGDDYEYVADFLSSIFKEIKNEDHENNYIIYGFVMDSIIAIDLVKIIQYLRTMEQVDKIVKGLKDPPLWYNLSRNHDIILNQCLRLQNMLTIEYGYWEHVLNGALYNHDRTIMYMEKYGDEYYRYMNNEEDDEDDDN